MTQRFPTESLVNFPGVNDELEVGIVRSYNTVTNKYHIICPDETVKSFDASELQERVCVEGRVNDFPSEDGWDKYLSDVPKRATQLVDPGVLAPTNPDNNLRQRKAQAMLRVERQGAKMIKEQIEAQQGSLTALYESMKELEAKMAEAKAKKDQIIARARTAKAATKVNDMLAGVGTSSSTAAFDRMADKVEQVCARRHQTPARCIRMYWPLTLASASGSIARLSS